MIKFTKREFLDNGIVLIVKIKCKNDNTEYKEQLFYNKHDREASFLILNSNVNLWKDKKVKELKRTIT